MDKVQVFFEGLGLSFTISPVAFGNVMKYGLIIAIGYAIAVVMGGFSGEHDISINSGNEVFKALDREKYEPYRIVVEPNEWFFRPDGVGSREQRQSRS